MKEGVRDAQEQAYPAAFKQQIAQSSELRRADAAVLLLPHVEQRLADAHLATHLVDGGARTTR